MQTGTRSITSGIISWQTCVRWGAPGRRGTGQPPHKRLAGCRAHLQQSYFRIASSSASEQSAMPNGPDSTTKGMCHQAPPLVVAGVGAAAEPAVVSRRRPRPPERVEPQERAADRLRAPSLPGRRGFSMAVQCGRSIRGLCLTARARSSTCKQVSTVARSLEVEPEARRRRRDDVSAGAIFCRRRRGTSKPNCILLCSQPARG